MTLNYSFLGEWSVTTKDVVGKWVKQKLTLVQDGEAPEDLFLEYIIVMIGNGKKMQELSHELQDFIGEQKAIDFASDLGVFLQSLSPPVVITPSVAVPQGPVSKEPTVVLKPSKDILDGGLMSSRSSSGVTQKNNSRLLDSALRSTNTTLAQKRVAPERSSSQSIGLSSTSSQQNPVVNNSAGLFTKRGSSNSTNNNSNQTPEGLGVVKKRKVIVEGNNKSNGLQIQPSFSEAQAMRNAAQAEAMHRGEFRPPIPYGHFEGPNFAPVPVDPKFAYMEQMNMMAHMSGFGSAEEMLFFQQSMMANMMGSGMNMNMNMNMPGMQMAGRGPNSSSAEHYPQQQHQQQRHRGGGFMAGRGRGFDGRGQSREPTGQFHQGSGAAARTLPPPPPPPRDQMPSKASGEEGVKSIPQAEGSEPVEGTGDPSVGSFGYSAGGVRGGYRGRGRGRGRGFSRGDFQGSSEGDAAGAGRGSSEFPASGGRFAYASRGRGAYRGRGSAAPTAEGGPPASFNKVWVREADIEGPLVAGR